MEAVILFVLSLLAGVFVLWVVIKPAVKNRAVRGGVVNTDRFSRHYCFRLPCNEREAVERLSVPNVKDAMRYSFDGESLCITFTHMNAVIPYALRFCVVGDTTYLKVSRVKLLHDKSNIAYLINRFFFEKLDAEPVACFENEP